MHHCLYQIVPRLYFVVRNNLKILGDLLSWYNKLYVEITTWWHRLFNASSLAYALILTDVFYYCGLAIWKHLRYQSVEYIVHTEVLVMNMACFLSICEKDSLAHLFRFINANDHWSDLILRLAVWIIDGFDMMGLFGVVKLVGFDLAPSILSVRRISSLAWREYREVYWGKEVPIGYEFDTSLVVDAQKRGRGSDWTEKQYCGTCVVAL